MLLRTMATMSLLVALPAAALAQARPDTRTMTCEGVRALVADRGAVVLTTGPHTYDRFVAGTGYCALPEVALPVSVPTRDGDGCVVYACRPDPFEE